MSVSELSLADLSVQSLSIEAPSDADLMVRVREGDRDAFGTLVERHKHPLVGYLSRLTRSPERAEDLAQEAFLRLFRSAHRYRENGQLTAYLFRIATNLLRSEERRERRWRLLAPKLSSSGNDHEEASAPRQLEHRELSGKLAAAIAELPMSFRVPLVLFEIEDWPQQEIARFLGVREGTVKSRIFRARERLRKSLSPYWNGEEP